MGKKGGSGGGGGAGKPGSGLSLWQGTSGGNTFGITDLSLLTTTAIDGLGGSDTLDLSGTSMGITIRLGETWHNRPSSDLSIEQGFIGIPWSGPPYTAGGYSALPGLVRNSLANLENIVGGSGNDLFEVERTSVASIVDGGGGNDYLSGGRDDILIGGIGEDWLGGQDPETIKVGGQWNGDFTVLPTGDGERDTFIDGGVILDFEVGTDRLLLGYAAEFDYGNWSDITWTDSQGGEHDAAYLPFGSVILVGMTAEDAMAITPAFMLAGNGYGGPLEGGAGDDVLYPGTAADTFVFSAGGGDDVIVYDSRYFDFAADSLHFSDVPAPGSGDWEQIFVNDLEGIVYDYGAGSVTILGLTVQSADLITVTSDFA